MVQNSKMIQHILTKIQARAGITQAQIDAAKEGQIINGCLVLLKDRYDERAYYNRDDILCVVAMNLTAVSAFMFCCCSNLELVCAPYVLKIEDGFREDGEKFGYGSFSQTALTDICFPRLLHAGSRAFFACEKAVAVSLPLCEEVADHAFELCSSIRVMSLPRARTIGHLTFSQCSSMTDLIIPAAESVGSGCVRKCCALKSVNCRLEASSFACRWAECKTCPVCTYELDTCLQRGKDLWRDLWRDQIEDVVQQNQTMAQIIN